MGTAKDDFDAIQLADANVKTATDNVTAAQASLVSAQGALVAARTADSTADQQLAADLAGGPGYFNNADGSITVVAADAGSPTGYSLTMVKDLASIPSVPLSAPSAPSVPAVPSDPSAPTGGATS